MTSARVWVKSSFQREKERVNSVIPVLCETQIVRRTDPLPRRSTLLRHLCFSSSISSSFTRESLLSFSAIYATHFYILITLSSCLVTFPTLVCLLAASPTLGNLQSSGTRLGHPFQDTLVYSKNFPCKQTGWSGSQGVPSSIQKVWKQDLSCFPCSIVQILPCTTNYPHNFGIEQYDSAVTVIYGVGNVP